MDFMRYNRYVFIQFIYICILVLTTKGMQSVALFYATDCIFCYANGVGSGCFTNCFNSFSALDINPSI